MNHLNKYFNVKFDLNYVKIYLHKSSNVVLVRYENDQEINLERAIEIVKHCKESVEIAKPVYAIIHPKARSFVTEEARDYFGNDEFNQKVVKATAVVVNGIVHRLVFNLYLKFNKPQSPIKAFRNLAEALISIPEIEG